MGQSDNAQSDSPQNIRNHLGRISTGHSGLFLLFLFLTLFLLFVSISISPHSPAQLTKGQISFHGLGERPLSKFFFFFLNRKNLFCTRNKCTSTVQLQPFFRTLQHRRLFTRRSRRSEARAGCPAGGRSKSALV